MHGWEYKYNYNYMGTYVCVIMHTYIAKMTTAGSVPLDIIIIIIYIIQMINCIIYATPKWLYIYYIYILQPDLRAVLYNSTYNKKL